MKHIIQVGIPLYLTQGESDALHLEADRMLYESSNRPDGWIREYVKAYVEAGRILQRAIERSHHPTS